MFVSYAQNFEDVILRRALGHVERGFYLDIGAQDPVIDSVSLAFHEQGWRGVHVEPTALYADRLRAARPDETVIAAAVGATDGAITFFEILETGLSTGDEGIAREHESKGFAVERVTVACMPLSRLLDEHGRREIHWLKIDVEGMEEQAIASWAPSPVRPWIVLIESTHPNSPVTTYAAWEPALLALGYDFVYFDGLNRFYVSAEHPELKKNFGPGPNVFDDFALSGLASAPFCQRLQEKAAQAWETASATLSGEIAAKNEALAGRDLQIAALNGQISELSQSINRAAQAWQNASGALAVELARRQAELDQSNRQIAELSESLEAARSDAAAQGVALAQATAAWESIHAQLRHEIREKDRKVAEMDAWGNAAAAHEAALAEQLRGLEQQVVSIHRSTSWRVAGPLRLAKRCGTWLITGTWAWITFAPGSRPHRVGRQMIIGLTDGIVVRPRLAARIRRMLTASPALSRGLRNVVYSARAKPQERPSAFPEPREAGQAGGASAHGGAAKGSPDLSAEPEGVRTLYGRLRDERERASRNAPSGDA